MKLLSKIIIILIVVLVVIGIFTSRSQKQSSTDIPLVEVVSEEELVSGEIEEDSIEDLLVPSPVDDGIIILGGDGIPGN